MASRIRAGNRLGQRNSAAGSIWRRHQQVAAEHEFGKAFNAAADRQIDEVIDLAATRRWLIHAFDAMPPAERRKGKKPTFVSVWLEQGGVRLVASDDASVQSVDARCKHECGNHCS